MIIFLFYLIHSICLFISLKSPRIYSNTHIKFKCDRALQALIIFQRCVIPQMKRSPETKNFIVQNIT